MYRNNYYKGYLPIYSLSLANELIKKGYCPQKIVRNQKNKEFFIFLFKKDFEFYNLVKELRQEIKIKHNK